MRGGVTDAGRTNNEQTVKIELLSQWKLEAEFRKNISENTIQCYPSTNEILTPTKQVVTKKMCFKSGIFF